MTNQEIYELMARFDQSGLTTLKVTRKDFSLELGKNVTVAAAPMASVVGVSTIPTPEAMADLVEEGTFVTAPLVGTFYAASQPGAEPFVTAGRQVKKGETLCLIEAMKMMSEIPAPADCVVEEILVDDGSAVGYGQPLFRVRRV